MHFNMICCFDVEKYHMAPGKKGDAFLIEAHFSCLLSKINRHFLDIQLLRLYKFVQIYRLRPACKFTACNEFMA